MSWFGGMAAGVAPRGTAAIPSASRSDILGKRYQPFANPFFDLASTYTPPTVKALFGFMKHFHLSHGIINAINTKAAEYPVTDLMLSHGDKGVLNKWNDLMHGVLNYRVHQQEFNLEYYVYGNSFISPVFPFTKYLKCPQCLAESEAMRTRSNWRYSNQGFWFSCPKCGQTGWATATDRYTPSINEFSLIRWNPENVQLFTNETTNRTDYSIDFSPDFKNQITMGRKDLVATTPQEILESVRYQRPLVFDRKMLFHMRRPSLVGMGGWGTPLALPVLKDVFFMQVMKKAQEAVVLTHLVPQIFLFPQPATGSADPFTTVNLSDWREHIRREVARQRIDPSYYGILPFPLGHQTIGENGKSLMLMPEIQTAAEHICVGMGFPVDLVFGQGTWSGSSVNMRMLENFFMSNVQAQKRLVHWVMNHFGRYMGWPIPDARFKPFRMADDLQRLQLMMQLRMTKEISSTAMLSQLDLKMEDEAELSLSELKIRARLLQEEAALTADVQGYQQLIGAKYMAKAQTAQQAALAQGAAQQRSPFEDTMQAGVSRQAVVTIDATAAALAKELERMPPERRSVWLSQLRSASPEMEQLVLQQQGAGLPPMPQDPGGAALQPAGQTVDMRPLPEQRPPRRASAL